MGETRWTLTRMTVRGARGRTFAIAAGMMTVCCLSAAPAWAKPFSLLTREDPAQVSAFTLNFGELGGVSSASIARTDYELELDAPLGLARFANYRQEVRPLTLPGGFSTGNIIVEVVAGSSQGSFDPRTGQFTTSELYAVYFEGDLSAYGLTSPVILPSTSAGAVAISPETGGTIRMAWVGQGELADPFDPNSRVSFTYTCDVNTVFVAEPHLLVRLDLVPDVLDLELPMRLEDDLVTKLERAAARLDEDNATAGVHILHSFVRTVQRSLRIPEEQAVELIAKAQQIMELADPKREGEPRE